MSNGCYRIVSQHSGKVLDVEGFRTDNGAQIQQWSWGGGTNQQWRLISAEGPQPGKYYRISALHSNKAISIAGPSPDDGANIHQWDYIQWNNQMWRLDDVGGGCYRGSTRLPHRQGATSGCSIVCSPIDGYSRRHPARGPQSKSPYCCAGR